MKNAKILIWGIIFVIIPTKIYAVYNKMFCAKGSVILDFRKRIMSNIQTADKKKRAMPISNALCGKRYISNIIHKGHIKEAIYSNTKVCCFALWCSKVFILFLISLTCLKNTNLSKTFFNCNFLLLLHWLFF